MTTDTEVTFAVAWAALMAEQRTPWWNRGIRRGVHAFWRWWFRTRPG